MELCLNLNRCLSVHVVLVWSHLAKFDVYEKEDAHYVFPLDFPDLTGWNKGKRDSLWKLTLNYISYFI